MDGRGLLFGVVAVLTLGLLISGCSPRAVSSGGSASRPTAKTNQTPAAAPSQARGLNSAQPKLYKPPPKQGKPFILEMAPGVTMEFVSIPAGTFTMGDPKEGIPRHEETIAEPFFLAATEVTQEQWEVLMATNPSLMKGSKYPVHHVNWEDCQEFLKAMNAKYAHTGKRFHLPTEAQWEYACRAGNVVKMDTPDDPARIEQYAWLGSNSKYEMHPVAQKKPNDWGLFDMQGNVAEWCADVLMPDPRGHVPGLPPDASRDSPDEPWYVVRGGTYRDGVSACQSTSRVVRRALVPMRHDGLRLACGPQ